MAFGEMDLLASAASGMSAQRSVLDITDLQLAEDYWIISKHLAPYPSVRVHSNVTGKGAALLQQLLGERVKDLLLKR